MKKNAQGLSISTIVIAAIAIIVLVVLIAIFSGRMTIWGKDLDKNLEGTKCTDLNGKINNTDTSADWFISCPSGYTAVYAKFSDNEPGKTCCKPLD